MSAANDVFLLEKILAEKRAKGLSWDKLAQSLPINGDSLRIAFKRNNVKTVHLIKICEVLGLEHRMDNQKYDVGLIYTPLITKYGYQEYSDHHDNITYLNEQQLVSWDIDSELYGTKEGFLTFEVYGDSMNNGSYLSFLDGDFLLGWQIKNVRWNEDFISNKSALIILHKYKGVIITRINQINGSSINCSFLNESFDNELINSNDIIKVYSVIKMKRESQF